MNLVLVTGRMTRDPIMRQSRHSGRVFCSMRFAIEGDYRGKADRRTNFIDLFAFGEKGRVMNKFVKKGMRMLLMASIDVYEGRDAYGYKKDVVCLVVKSWEMIDARDFKEPIEDLSDSKGNLLIPKEITDSLIKQIDTKDEDIPDDFVDLERRADDLL